MIDACIAERNKTDYVLGYSNDLNDDTKETTLPSTQQMVKRKLNFWKHFGKNASEWIP